MQVHMRAGCSLLLLLMLAGLMLLSFGPIGVAADFCDKFSNCFDCISESLHVCSWCSTNSSCLETGSACPSRIESYDNCPCSNGGRSSCQKCVEAYSYNHCLWCPTVGCNAESTPCASPAINATAKCPVGPNNLPAWKIVLIILGVTGGLTLIVCCVAIFCFCGVNLGSLIGWRVDEATRKDPILADRSHVRKYHTTS